MAKKPAKKPVKKPAKKPVKKLTAYELMNGVKEESVVDDDVAKEMNGLK